jgi:DNA polymerase I-like protein with 3'-5' exonuclease and polymerase domains
MVGAVRWKGFTLDIPALKALRVKAEVKSMLAPKAPGPVLHYVTEHMDEIEKLHFETHKSTKKTILEEVAAWEGGDHPAAVRAQEVLDARQYKSECTLFDKLITAGRFHASFSVIGTLSSRMSGRGSGLNSQGIKRAKEIRQCFPLSTGSNVLCGGDFVSFEVVLADAVYADPDLRKDLTTELPCGYCGATGKLDGGECPVCEGAGKYVKKIHALFGQHVYPNMTYEEIVADKEKYTRSKSAVFAMLYGGEAFTLKTRLGVEIEIAEKAYQLFTQQYKKVGEGRKLYNDMFCSMRQPGGVGSNVEWHEPSNFIESIFGFRRYFTLENMICEALYRLGSKPPKHWRQYQGKVMRRDREQKVSGAAMSALFAAAFALQSANMRAAGNHVIQSSGAHITKQVQRNIWDMQPSGVGEWIVQPMNIHDEIMCPTHPDHVGRINKVVKDTVEEFRPKVPLIEIDWGDDLNSWADK